MQILQAIDARFNQIDDSLAAIHGDTQWIKGYIIQRDTGELKALIQQRLLEKGAAIQPLPQQQPQIMVIPQSGSGGFTPSSMRPTTSLLLQTSP